MALSGNLREKRIIHNIYIEIQYTHYVLNIFVSFFLSFFTTLHADLRNQVTAVGAPATVPTGDTIGVAAKALSDASYPFLKEAHGSKGHIFWGHCHCVFVCGGSMGSQCGVFFSDVVM